MKHRINLRAEIPNRQFWYPVVIGGSNLKLRGNFGNFSQKDSTICFYFKPSWICL